MNECLEKGGEPWGRVVVIDFLGMGRVGGEWGVFLRMLVVDDLGVAKVFFGGEPGVVKVTFEDE